MSDPVPSAHSFDATAATFQTAVVEASQSVPVVLDFWAGWCGPCKQLGPLLERLAEEYGGKFRLAKVDVEREQDLAGGFGVSSIPHVAAVRGGQIVDEFVGLRGEAELRAWLDALMPSPIDALLAEGAAAETTDPAAAEAAYREADAAAPGDDRAKVALARLLLRLDRYAESRAFIDRLAARGFLEPDAEQVKAQLDLRSAAAETGGVEEARRAVETSPDDWDAKLRLADALAVAGKPQEALDLLIEVVRGDRAGHGEPARAATVRLFDTLGPTHPLVAGYRRKLATALY